MAASRPAAKTLPSVPQRGRHARRCPERLSPEGTARRGGEDAVAPRATLLARVPKGSPLGPGGLAMIRVPLADLRAHVGETVSIAGWVHALRRQRAMQFVVLRD